MYHFLKFVLPFGCFFDFVAFLLRSSFLDPSAIFLAKFSSVFASKQETIWERSSGKSSSSMTKKANFIYKFCKYIQVLIKILINKLTQIDMDFFGRFWKKFSAYKMPFLLSHMHFSLLFTIFVIKIYFKSNKVEIIKFFIE